MTSSTSQKLSFASFWHGGKLSAYEMACLCSLALRGNDVTLYSYNEIENVPEPIKQGNAKDIVDQRFVDGFLIKGVPSLSHFSDLFRYRLFLNTDHIWIDADMLMIRPIDFQIKSFLIGNEDADRLCGAIMRIDSAHPKLPLLISSAEAAFAKQLVWGETGPRLLTKIFGKAEINEEVFMPETFYPLHYTVFWKALLPEYREECEELCKNAYTIHLWNSVVGHIGIWKRYMPPAGSYLHSCFVADGTDRFFDGTYPENVMRQMVDNWNKRLSGTDLALRQVLQQLVPGLFRTINRRKADLQLKFSKIR